MSDGVCNGRVAIVTGAGRGLGREYALSLARNGAMVVVNDLGVGPDGGDDGSTPAAAVVKDIEQEGGRAVSNADDVASWEGSRRLVASALDSFGRLDVLVNNAGILRDRMVVSMTEAEWDDVVRIHLKGTFSTMHHAAAYWRERSKQGDEIDARVINTTSASGLYGNSGQSNYAAAKAGVAMLTLVAADELGRYGVTVNAVAPGALTRLTAGLEMAEDRKAQFGADRVAPLVTWLASPMSSGVSGEIFECSGRVLAVSESWHRGPSTDEVPIEIAEINSVCRSLLAKRRPRTRMSDVATSSDVAERDLSIRATAAR